MLSFSFYYHPPLIICFFSYNFLFYQFYARMYRHFIWDVVFESYLCHNDVQYAILYYNFSKIVCVAILYPYRYLYMYPCSCILLVYSLDQFSPLGLAQYTYLYITPFACTAHIPSLYKALFCTCYTYINIQAIQSFSLTLYC